MIRYAAKQHEFVASFCDPGTSCLCYDKCAFPGGDGRAGQSKKTYLDVRSTNMTHFASAYVLTTTLLLPNGGQVGGVCLCAAKLGRVSYLWCAQAHKVKTRACL